MGGSVLSCRRLKFSDDKGDWPIYVMVISLPARLQDNQEKAECRRHIIHDVTLYFDPARRLGLRDTNWKFSILMKIQLNLKISGNVMCHFTAICSLRGGILQTETLFFLAYGACPSNFLRIVTSHGLLVSEVLPKHSPVQA
jgi:hypothetical protein